MACELTVCPKVPSKQSLFGKVKFPLFSKNSEPDREGKKWWCLWRGWQCFPPAGFWKGFRRCVLRHGNVCHFSWLKSKDLAGWVSGLGFGSGKYQIICELCIYCCLGSATFQDRGGHYLLALPNATELEDEMVRHLAHSILKLFFME